MALTCSIMTAVFSQSTTLDFISCASCAALTCLLFFLPSIIVGISKKFIIFLLSKTLMAPLTPGSIPKTIMPLTPAKLFHQYQNLYKHFVHLHHLPTNQ